MSGCGRQGQAGSAECMQHVKQSLFQENDRQAHLVNNLNRATLCHTVSRGTLTCIAVFCIRPARALSRVDLPAPGGPRSRVMRPGLKVPLTSSRMQNCVLLGFMAPTFCNMLYRQQQELLRVGHYREDALKEQLISGLICASSCS